MGPWRYVAECDRPPSHYPPVESCVILGRTARGAIRVLERFPTPVDDNGIPDPYETLRLLTSTLDAGYELPHQTNVHHQVYHRSEYVEPVEREFRESYSLMMDWAVQMHNFAHAALLRAVKPPIRVMAEYVGEQNSINTLHRLGSAALHNERQAQRLFATSAQMRPTDRREALEQVADAKRRSTIKRHIYEKTLAWQQMGVMGLMPDPAMLEAMSMREAVTYLGKIGGNRFLDFRHASQDSIRRYGIRQGASFAIEDNAGNRLQIAA